MDATEWIVLGLWAGDMLFCFGYLGVVFVRCQPYGEDQ